MFVYWIIWNFSGTCVKTKDGEKNLHMTGRKWSHSRGHGAMCQTDVGLQQIGLSLKLRDRLQFTIPPQGGS